MTNQELRAYFQNLAKFLDKKANTVRSLNPLDVRPWAIDVLDKMKLQITAPTNLQLLDSTVAFENEFVSFLRQWRKSNPGSASDIDSNYHSQSVIAAGVYLRQLSRLYKEIGK